jgi:hypothetical protein
MLCGVPGLFCGAHSLTPLLRREEGPFDIKIHEEQTACPEVRGRRETAAGI